MKAVSASKKALIKAIVSMALSCVVFIFALVAGGSVAFGWFITNRNTPVGGNTMQTETDDIAAVYNVFAYDIKGNATSPSVSDSHTVDAGQTLPYDINGLVMNPYDKVFTNRNIYTPVVIRIAITGPQSLEQNGTINLTLERDTTKDATSVLFFSSVVKFSCLKGASIYNASLETTFNNVVNSLSVSGSTMVDKINSFKTTAASGNYDSGNVRAFIYTQNQTYAKFDRLVFTINYTESDFNVINGENTLNLYLYIDYDKTFIEEFIQQKIGSDLSITEVQEEAENDLLQIGIKPVQA
ncbi:MAG: hypothetical protein IJU83_04265 [Clostridia bacterium]|nr:hypothetical protein [Clostridia bacterium]